MRTRSYLALSEESLRPEIQTIMPIMIPMSTIAKRATTMRVRTAGAVRGGVVEGIARLTQRRTIALTLSLHHACNRGGAG